MLRDHLVSLALVLLAFGSFLGPLEAAVTAVTENPELDAGAIDRTLAAKWTAAKLTPSGPASDAVFLRRAYLDLAGVIPPYEEIARFRESGAPDRKERVIEQLLASPRFAEHWGESFRHVVLGRKTSDQFQITRAFDAWMADRIGRGIGLDRIARDILTAEGTPLESPAVAAIEQFEDSREDMAGHFAKVFLGVQIQCAQCHDHPFEKWTRNDFYGMAAFFARARKVNVPEAVYAQLIQGRLTRADQVLGKMDGVKPEELKPTNGRYKTIQEALERFNVRLASAKPEEAYRPREVAALLHPPEMESPMGAAPGMMASPAPPKQNRNHNLSFEAERGELEMPPAVSEDPALHKKGAIRPRFLTGEVMPAQDAGMNRRELLALWVTAPDNPFFARAMVNRVWAKLMGRGLVEPVDNVTNPSDGAHAQLLERMAAWFVAHHYDLKSLVRLIVSTDAYRRSCEPTADNARDTALYSRALVRPLEPEQILASLLEATGIEHTFKKGQGKQFEDLRMNFTRQFVHQFQVDEPGETTKFHGTISQALFTMNSGTFARSIRGIAGSVIDELKRLPDTQTRITMLCWRVLAREPTSIELPALAGYVDHKILDATWGKPAPLLAAGPRPPGPPPPRLPEVISGLHPDSMWRAYEDVLWGMLASAEFQNNH